jgi:hypothetical protein
MAGEAIRRLPTLADQQANWRQQFTAKYAKKPAPIAKLERSVAKKKADDKDARELAQWSAAVRKRDRWTDRYTGKPVKKAKEVGVAHPDCGHAHHVEPRTNVDVRYDRRNGLTVSWATHLRLEANELTVIGKKYFTKNGKKYLNCDHASTRIVEVPA